MQLLNPVVFFRQMKTLFFYHEILKKKQRILDEIHCDIGFFENCKNATKINAEIENLREKLKEQQSKNEKESLNYHIK